MRAEALHFALSSLRGEPQGLGVKMAAIKGKFWCWTWNNYPEDGEQRFYDEYHPSYMVVGREVGAQGTRHLQGYAEWNSARRLSDLHNGIAEIHFERRRGTGEQAATYCKKDGDFVEAGERSEDEQGHRSDLDAIDDAIREGATLREIACMFPSQWIRYNRGITSLYEQYHDEDERIMPECYWVYGPTGVGKTYSVTHRHWGNFSRIIDNKGQWFDGYRVDKEAFIIDEFKGGLDFPLLDAICEGYPVKVPVKGGFVRANPKYVYIISLYPPTTFWEEDQAAQILRRMKRVVFIPELNYPVEWN